MSLTKEQQKILNVLVDKYERSATFRGKSRVNQSFFLKPEAVFPKYADEREYDFFTVLNQDIRVLRDMGYVSISERNMRITKVVLCTERLQEIYPALGREPKRNVLEEVAGLLREEKAFIERTYPSGDLSTALRKCIEEQEKRLAAGKLPEYYEDSMEDYRDLWKAFRKLQEIREDVYIRDLSVKLYHDSKRLEHLRTRISGCLYRYGDYPDRDTVLEECNVIRTPSYVMIRGPVIIILGEQTLDVGKLNGDIAFSTRSLKDITGVTVYGKKVITVENLTSFHRDDFDRDEVLIYLGGYHNSAKREFLHKLYSENMGLTYEHFGDIDAGGFYIYEHLRRKTGIPFRTRNMDAETLERYAPYTKKLTANDIDRIKRLIAKYENGEMGNPEGKDITETLRLMLEKGVKLEQEAVNDWGRFWSSQNRPRSSHEKERRTEL